MKIVHLCLGCFYPDNYSYQENLLPKFHKELGYEVEVIASTQSFDKNGKTCFLDKTGSYQNEYDIKVTRLPYKKNNSIGHKLKQYIGTYSAIESAAPDILFIHGAQFMDISEVVKYLKKHKNVKVFVDSHADFSNSATNKASKLIHKTLWRYFEQKINPYTEKFYGVLPARVDFLVNMYKLPKEKCELLVMGADDDLVEKANHPEVKKELRERYNIAEDDFLVVTGGKIDQWKTQTLLLMEAVKNIPSEKVKLLVFGSVTRELMNKVTALADGEKVQYIGWIQANNSYNYFAAADLVVFPGRHSVFWEQVAAQGIPMLCKEWDGTKHVDIGGNVRFLTQDSTEEIQNAIETLTDNPEEYNKMKEVAVREGMKTFSYRDIAKRAIEQ